MDYTILHRGEKDAFQPQGRTKRRKRPSGILKTLIALLTVITLLAVRYGLFKAELAFTDLDDTDQQDLRSEEACPQFPAIKSVGEEKIALVGLLEKRWLGDEFKKESIEKLRRAVVLPTISYDDMGKVGVDERWEVFEKFHGFLEEAFPLV